LWPVSGPLALAGGAAARIARPIFLLLLGVLIARPIALLLLAVPVALLLTVRIALLLLLTVAASIVLIGHERPPSKAPEVTLFLNRPELRTFHQYLDS
jgi:hypothetical protein